MKQYAVMLQTDPDDEFFTRTTLGEMGLTQKFEFSSIDTLESLFDKYGLPVVILINDNSSWPARDHLQRLKSNEFYAHIPVVILGETVTKEYIDQYYNLGASTYITKPFTVVDTQKKIDAFTKYWFEAAN
jgi:two-component system response regulator